MAKHIIACASILALVAIVPPALASDDCEARIDKLDESKAEGPDRLAEKNEVIEFCYSQYKRDKAIDRLVKECSKYEEQPVVKMQAVADCQLAAYKYANELRSLKMDYRK